MISEMFKAVLVMSAASSVVAALLFALRRMCGRFWGHKIRYRAWLAVLVIAVMPLSFGFCSRGSDTTEIIHNIGTVQQKLTYTAPIQSATDVSEVASSAVDLSLWDVIALIWMIVAAVKLIVFICNYSRFLHKTFTGAKFKHKIGKVSVYEADILPAPIAVGVLKKRIIMPPDISDEMRTIVEMHECMHFKHYDIPFKWIAAVVGCIHWFNPIFRIVSQAIDEDCEIYCDMAVCDGMSDLEKKYYMNTILSLITSASGCSVYTAMANSKQNIVRRFAYITNGDGKNSFIRSLAGVSVLTVLFVFAAILSGIAGGRVYDGSVPAIRLNFSAVNTYTPQNAVSFVRKETDNTTPFSDNKEIGVNKADVSDIRDDLPSDNKNNISDEHTTEVVQMPENNTNKDYSLSVSPQQKNTVSEALKKDAVLPSVSTEVSDKAANVFSQKAEEEIIKSDYESDEFRYPYSGSVKYDGLTLDAIEQDIEQNGGRKSSPDGVDLKNSYISDKLSYLNGGVSQIRNVTTDSNGQVSFYMNSEYDQHIEVSIEQNGKQVAGYGIIPDNETTYVFGGLNPDETYDITISSSTGGSWKIENDYIIY